VGAKSGCGLQAASACRIAALIGRGLVWVQSLNHQKNLNHQKSLNRQKSPRHKATLRLDLSDPTSAIQDVAIYKIALDAATVATHFNNGNRHDP
jgi:hypothetical protein